MRSLQERITEGIGSHYSTFNPKAFIDKFNQISKLLTLKYSFMSYSIETKDGTTVGEVRFGSLEELGYRKALPIEMVYVEEAHQRKGYYSDIVFSAHKAIQKLNVADCIASYKYDLGSEQKRSKLANQFWDNLVAKGKASKTQDKTYFTI